MNPIERLEEIDLAIAEVVDILDSKKELEEHLVYIEHKRHALKNKVNQLYAFVDKEQAQFENLEVNSVVSLFYKVLGLHEGWYEQEKQDFVEAALKYNAALDQLHLLDFEVKIVRRKLKAIEETNVNIDNLLVEKQRIINVYDMNKAREIGRFDTLIYSNRKQKQIGYKLIYEMEKILKDLHFILEIVSKTGKWMLNNRGDRNNLPFWYNKHIKLASRAATRAQNNLDDFNVHLNKYDPDLTINKIYITDYLDKLFDQLIKDWVANYYFKSSETSLNKSIEVLERLKLELESKIDFFKKDSELIEKEKKEFLMKLKY